MRTIGTPMTPSGRESSVSVVPGLLLAGLTLLLAACGGPTEGPPDPEPPAREDVDTPFPIDRGEEDSGTPSTYKGLPLRLTEADEPTVTPVDGVLGVVCIGMSNSAQECGTYLTLLEQSWRPQVSPAVQVVNCALGGHAIERWIDSSFDATLWDRCVQELIPAAGMRLDQIRVIYHKAANQFTLGPGGASLPPYPHQDSDYFAFQRNLTAFANRVPDWFPGVEAVYTTSRSFGGFSLNPGRGEPLSYEEGHALNSWLRSNSSVRGVWHGWGPYLWAPSCADGILNGSGICYLRSDFVEDGVHPSAAGRAKIAEIVHRRFLDHAWYRR